MKIKKIKVLKERDPPCFMKQFKKIKQLKGSCCYVEMADDRHTFMMYFHNNRFDLEIHKFRPDPNHSRSYYITLKNNLSANDIIELESKIKMRLL